MVFNCDAYEKVFPRKEPEQAAPVIKQPEQGNVLEAAEKVIDKEPDPAPDGINDPEGGDLDGTE